MAILNKVCDRCKKDFGNGELFYRIEITMIRHLCLFRGEDMPPMDKKHKSPMEVCENCWGEISFGLSGKK